LEIAMREMSPREYADLAAGGTAPFLLDVRESWELALASVAGVTHIPMAEIPNRLTEIPRDREVVVMCKAGGRSATVARFLEAQGYDRVINLSGGILAWSAQVDPTVATY
jgi:rhodanese-related sulfurtransferase